MHKHILGLIGIGLLGSVTMTGCVGGGGSGSNDFRPGSGAIHYRILDLETGFAVNVASVGDLSGNSAYVNDFLALRWMPNGVLERLSDPDPLHAGGAGDGPTVQEVQGFYIGLLELTQGQWQTLGGTDPWHDIVPAAAVGSTETVAGLPASNISRSDMTITLAESPVLTNLRLPDGNEWEYAARGGSTCVFHWGDNMRLRDVDDYAVFWQSTDHVGPHRVGSREPNAFNLWDIHGNISEMTRSGHARGGSWADPLFDTRLSRRVAVPSGAEHPLYGFRLVLEAAPSLDGDN